MTTTSELQALKEKYADEGLRRETLHEDPLQQFQLWYQQAIDADLPEPNAMCVATATASAAPSQRTVLMKSYDHDGLVFYTNYDSRKAQQLAENDQVSLLFPWIGLHRQVIVEGRASRISAAESLRYFATRPRGSQLGAWSSQQSEVLSSRSLLEAKLDQIKRKFARGEVPLPSFWGGYRVRPHRIEFWQGRPHRLHDRFLFTLEGEGEWKIERLAP
ncbi:MAG: pyridoxamine 5'-phosphate oxidase [Pseudomonadota bacterium]|nr:pyridoxamine 5'-phosphate oxidase [Pseudomonadota bacterium]